MMREFGSVPADSTGKPCLGLMCCLLVLAAGCADKSRYYASTLPDHLQVRPIDNVQTVDLSRLATTTVSNEFIDRGDVLEITISAGLTSDDTTTIPARVSESGTAQLPVIGPVHLAGLELEGAEQAIAAACRYRGLYKDPHVTVTMKRQRMNKVTVIGAVEEPGAYDLPRGASDLLSAIVAAGGLAKDAGTHVEIRQPGTIGGADPGRPAPVADSDGNGPRLTAGFSPAPITTTTARPKAIRVNLVTAAQEGRGGVTLDDGAVIMVEKRDPAPVQVIGLVNKPARYDFPVGQDLRVLDAIALAGGVSSNLADKVWVSRRVPGSPDPAVIELSIKEAKQKGNANIRLMPGDVVSVEQTPATILLDTIRLINFGVGTSLNTLF